MVLHKLITSSQQNPGFQTSDFSLTGKAYGLKPARDTHPFLSFAALKGLEIAAVFPRLLCITTSNVAARVGPD